MTNIIKLKNKKIKLIIFPGNFLPNTGGLETHVNEFVKHLSKLTIKKEDYNYLFKIVIFTPNTSNTLIFETIHKDVKVIRYPAMFLIPNFPIPKIWKIKFWKLYLNLYKHKYDTVMTRTRFFTNSFLGLIFAKFRFKKSSRIKLIHVEHGSDFVKLSSKLKSFLAWFYDMTLGKLLIKGSDKIIAISIGVYKFIRRYFSNRRDIPIIRRGFDYNYFLKIKPNLNLKRKYKDKIIISFAGRLVSGKGVQDIIKVLAILKVNYKDEFNNFKLIIIGDGDYRKDLENLVRKHDLSNSVEFLGRLDYDKVISILKISDIFINPSYTEGLPTSILDAFFSGNKIIATNVGGTYEILEEDWNSGRYKLIEPKNLDQLKRSILELSIEKKRLSNKLLLKIKNKFDWEDHTHKYAKILIELYNKK